MERSTIDEAIEHERLARSSTNPKPVWLNTKTAAKYLSAKEGTLKTWRAKGVGPKYHVIQGKMVRYHVDDLNAFVRGEVNND
ncbi:MAG: helix-turn-helix domain-containing protein [Pseudomonadota bacterium]